jgi:hypothetical protein
LSGFLLDANVASMLTPSRAEASAAFLKWLERRGGEGRLGKRWGAFDIAMRRDRFWRTHPTSAISSP